MNRTLLLLLAVSVLAGCAGYQIEDTEHYRAIRPDTPVNLQFEYNRTYAEGTASALSADDRAVYTVVVANMPISVREYAELRDIPTSEGSDARVVTIRFQGVNVSFGNVQYLADVHIETAPGHFEMRKVGLTVSSSMKADVIAWHMAARAIDEAVLIWHPAAEVATTPSKNAKVAGTGLIPIYPLKKDAPLAPDEPMRLNWESFPSARLLAGSGIEAADITDVVYDVDVFAGDFYSLDPDDMVTLRVNGLFEPELLLDQSLPYCGRFIWRVRARFKLHGQPRMTEWNTGRFRLAHYDRRASATWTVDPRLTQSGVFTQVGAPEPFTCTNGIWADKSEGIRTANSTKTAIQLEPMRPGEKVLSGMLVGTRCGIPDDLCSTDAYRDINRKFRSSLQRELRRLQKGVEAVDGVDVVSGSPAMPEKQAFMFDLHDFQQWVRDPQNRQYLLDQGIRRTVVVWSEETETDMGTYDTSSSDVGYVHFGSRQIARMPVFADVMDVASGKLVARVDMTIQSEDSSGMGIFLIIPYAYSIDENPFEESVDEMSRALSFILMGGRAGWPKEFVPVATAMKKRQ